MQRIILILFFCLFTSVTFAQEKISADSIKRIVKEDVIITSTRTPENPKQVPLSVSTVPVEAFRDARGYELKDALWQVPGVFSQARSGHTDMRITIRGFGSRGAGDRSNAGNMRGIRVLVDGIPETEPDGRTSLDNVDMSNYSSAEVLRSNASTLYGSAAGGVISLHSNTSFATPFVQAGTHIGSFGYMRTNISAGAVAGSSQIFVSGTGTTYDGYRDHSQSNTGNANIVINSSLGDRTNLQVVAGGASNIFRFPGPLTMAQFEADPLQADSLYKARDEHRFNRVGRMGFTLDHTFEGEHMVSGTAYLQPKVLTRSERNSWREFNRISIGTAGQYAWTKAMEGGSKNVIMAGFDQQYQDGPSQFFNLTSTQSRGKTITQDKREASSNVGLYIQDQIKLGDLILMAGGRYDMINYEYEDYLGVSPKSNLEFTAFTPKLAVGYLLSENQSLYASFGGGLEAPAFNEIDPPNDSIGYAYIEGTKDTTTAFNPFLDPAKSTTLELGWKGVTSIDGLFPALSFDVSAFYIMIKNDIIPWNGGAYYFTAGQTHRLGAELALSAYTDFGLSVRTAFTFMDAKYDDYTTTSGNYDGNKQAGIPSLFGNLRLRYDTDLGLYIEAGLETVGEYYADDRNDMNADGTPNPSVNSLAPSYTIFNSTLGYRANIVRELTLNAFASMNNLTDQSYVSSVFINGTGNRYFESGMPRSYVVGVSLQYNFAAN
jgi:iron complex outermembrane receptor protein